MKKFTSLFTEDFKLKNKGLIKANSLKPTTKEELVQLIDEFIKNYGYECDLNDIDTSLITDMSELFKPYKRFNGDISNWDVSNVTNMHSMFINCYKFKGDDISGWNVENVTDMQYMFYNCSSFDCKYLDDWKANENGDFTNMLVGTLGDAPEWWLDWYSKNIAKI